LVRSGLIRLLIASDESYDAHAYTAPQTLPLGTKLVVSCKGCSVPVTVNDRGPYLGDRA
jgi:peptidoglycan lytic transglycosylase